MSNRYKQYKKAKKEKNLADKGLALGSTAAGLGGATLLGREYIKRNLGAVAAGEGPTIEELKKATAKGKKLVDVAGVNPENLKTAKRVGAGLAVAGGTLAGVSAYKSYKARKKLEELEGKKNDSKKK